MGEYVSIVKENKYMSFLIKEHQLLKTQNKNQDKIKNDMEVECDRKSKEKFYGGKSTTSFHGKKNA